MSGVTLMAFAVKRMTSASLPGVSDPVRLSSQFARAPPAVATCTMSFTVRSGGTFDSLARSRVKICMRCRKKFVRICVKKSEGISVSTSLLSDQGILWSRACWIGGMPCPISISIGVASDRLPPELAISFHSSAVRWQQWMYVTSGPMSLASGSSRPLPLSCKVMGAPTSRATSQCLGSNAVASASVSSWSSVLKYCLRRRRIS